MKKEYIYRGEKKIIKSCNGDYYDSFSFAGKSYALHFNAINSFGARARFASKIINAIKKAAYITATLLILNMTVSGYTQTFTDPVAAGTTVTGEMVSGGLQQVFGTTENTIVQNGGYQQLYPSGISKNTTVNDGGEQWVSGGTSNNTTLNKNGEQIIEQGGVGNNTIVYEGAYQLIKTGGASYDTIINDYGEQEAKDGGIAERTTINSYGSQYVSNGGTANNTILNSMAIQLIASGGSANNTVNNGALVTALSGSKINNYTGKYGTIIMSGDNTLSGNTNLIGGALNIMNSGSFNTINIENLQSDNAVINMNVDMEKHTGDLLKISGSYNGSSLIKLKNIAPIFTQTNGDGLKLVEIGNTATGSGTFALAGGKWDAGGYEYMLYRGTENAVGNDWYLRSSNSFSDVFKTMIDIPLLNSVLAETGMNSLQKRLGDLRNMGSGDNGIWARTHYKSITIDELQKTDMRMFGVEAGYDRLITPGENNKIYAGVMLGYIKSEDIKVKQSNGYYGNGKGETPSVGIYGALINERGWFIDLVARNFWTKLDMTSYSSGGTELLFKPKRNVAALSAEAGKEIKTELGETSYIRTEPKIKAEYMNASSGSAQVLNGVDDLSWDRTDYLSGKAEISIGYVKKRRNGLLIEPLLELAYKHEFLGSGTVKYGGASYETDLSGGVIEGNIGLNMQLTEDLYWYALGGYEKGSKISGWGANAGVRYSFGKKDKKTIRERQNKIKNKEKALSKPLKNNDIRKEKVISASSSADLKRREIDYGENPELNEAKSLYHAAFYKFNAISLDKVNQESVKDITQSIKKQEYRKLIIRGHTDNIGTYTVNKRISLMRAQSVKSELNKDGIFDIELIGEGYDKPMADNKTKEGRAKNRRVDIEIIRSE